MKRRLLILGLLFGSMAPLPAGDTMVTRMGIPRSPEGILVDHPLSWTASVSGPAVARTLRLAAPGSPRVALMLTTIRLPQGLELTRASVSDLSRELGERFPSDPARPRPLLEIEGDAVWGFYTSIRDPQETLPEGELRYLRVGALVVGPIAVAFHLLSDASEGPGVASALAALRSLRPDSHQPPAPTGFEWVDIEAIGARFLKPRGWNERLEAGSGPQRFTFGRDPFESGASPTTGLTVQVFHDATGHFGRLAPNAARAHLAAARRLPGVAVASTWSEDFDRIQLHGHVIVRPDAAALAGVVVAQLAVGNADTDTLYLVRFETPEAQWENGDGEIATTILGHFMLDPRM